MESSGPDDPQRAAGEGAPGQPGTPTYPPGDDHDSGRSGIHQPPPPTAGSSPHRHQGRSRRGGVAARAGRAGSGGRWWLWVGRAVLWAFILVVIFNGIRTPFLRVLQPADTASTAASTDGGFPRSAASAYALQFAHAYLTYGESQGPQRSRLLADYLPKGADPQLGWNGEGTLRLQAAQVAGVRARDATHAVVTLSVKVSDQWMRLAVPVYAKQDAMVISGQPALMPRPPEAQLPPATDGPTDEATATELRRQLPGFFQAYAGSDAESLARYLAPGVSLTGFAGAVRFRSLDDIVVPQGSDTSRRVTATVTWELLTGGRAAAGELQQTYQLTVTKDDGRWYVKAIQGAPGKGFS